MVGADRYLSVQLRDGRLNATRALSTQARPTSVGRAFNPARRWKWHRSFSRLFQALRKLRRGSILATRLIAVALGSLVEAAAFRSSEPDNRRANLMRDSPSCFQRRVDSPLLVR